MKKFMTAVWNFAIEMAIATRYGLIGATIMATAREEREQRAVENNLRRAAG